jgi:septal ring factor EnvC (AmiA/AmiB activator)
LCQGVRPIFLWVCGVSFGLCVLTSGSSPGAFLTAVLAAGAVVTAVFAFLAFRQQASEVATLKQQARDQSRQLELQRLQYAEQHEVSSKESAVLELRAQELASSLANLERETAKRRRAQADRVHFWDERRYLSPEDLAVRMNDEVRNRGQDFTS